MARNFLNGINLNNTELLNLILQQLATAPTNVRGKVYYDTATETVKFMDGTNVRTLGRLDQISAPTASVSMNSQKITTLADGTAASDAATKGQLDAAILGLDLREEVRVASLTNGAITTAYVNGAVVDGVTLATGDRILLAGQTAGAENGIRVVAASGAPARASDFNTAALAERGVLVPVVEGTSNRGLYLHTTAGAITLDTTALTFFRINAPSSGGVAKYSANVGNGSLTAITVTHNLNTLDVQVQVWRANALVEPDITITDANNIVLTYATAPTTNQDRVVVLG